MMPQYDGWEVLKEIREFSEIPVIMLTALGDEKHEVFGLKKGADDYIGKPFSYEVFIARVNTLLRKVKKERLAELVIGNMVVSQASHTVSVDNREIELNKKEYTLLAYMIKNRDLVLTRDQILCDVWGYDFEGDSRTIDTNIKTLRAKLGDCGEYIRTVRGTGYMFKVAIDDKND
jgi:DNA-binding response OmpR family regulator